MPACAHRDGDVLFFRVLHRPLHILDVRAVDDGVGPHEALVGCHGGSSVLTDTAWVTPFPISHYVPSEGRKLIILCPAAVEKIEKHSPSPCPCWYLLIYCPARHITSSLGTYPSSSTDGAVSTWRRSQRGST